MWLVNETQQPWTIFDWYNNEFQIKGRQIFRPCIKQLWPSPASHLLCFFIEVQCTGSWGQWWLKPIVLFNLFLQFSFQIYQQKNLQTNIVVQFYISKSPNQCHVSGQWVLQPVASSFAEHDWLPSGIWTELNSFFVFLFSNQMSNIHRMDGVCQALAHVLSSCVCQAVSSHCDSSPI